MNKITTAALAGLVGVAMTANASVSRWEGLGNIGAAFVADVQDYTTLPSTVAGNKNAIYLEDFDGENDSEWGGMHLEVGPGVLGIWLNRPYQDNLTNWWWVPNNFYGTNSPQENLDLIYAWALSEETTLAVGLNRANYFYQESDKGPNFENQETYSFSGLGLSLGLGQANVGPLSLLEVGLVLDTYSTLYSDKVTSPTASENKDTGSGMDISLRVGADTAGDDGAFGRYELGLSMDSASTKVEPNTAPASNVHVENKFSELSWNLGYAAGRKSESSMGLVGVMLKNSTWTQKQINENNIAGNEDLQTWNDFELVVGAAAETKVNSWFALRGGISGNALSNYSYENKYDSAASQDSTYTEVRGYANDNNAEISIGASFTFGSLTLDTVVDREFFINGPYFISGEDNELNTRVSGTFVF